MFANASSILPGISDSVATRAKRERCTESGILMEEFEESEDDEDPNKPGPVEAYAFRACGKACGTCE